MINRNQIMRNKHIARILFGAFTMLSLVFFTACDDSDEGGAKVELLSFGPSGVKHGEEIVVIGKNLDKVNSIVFYPNVEVSSDQFTSVKGNELRLVVPAAAESGKVTLKTAAGDIESKSIFSLEVPVVITTMTEVAKPGANITITGEFLNWVESVVFADGLEVDDFVSQSMNEIVVTVPMEAKTGFLKLYSGGTEPLEITILNPLTITLPAVTELSPSSVRHAGTLTVKGTDLDLVTQITFPDGSFVTATEFVSQTETQIVLTVPITATNGELILTAPSGVEVADGSLTIQLPIVTSLSPDDPAEHVEGNSLSLIGTNLDLVAKIKFPGVTNPVTTFTKTSTKIDVEIPAGVQGGTIILTTIHDFIVPVEAPFGDQLVLATVMFDDAAKAPLGVGGGWNDVITDAVNTENPRVGSVSMKVTYNGSWGGGAQLGNWDGQSVSTANTAYYAFSIYGGADTEGKEINVNVAGVQVTVVIEEGVWKDVQIPLSSFNNPATINEIWFQDRGWSGTVWIDQIGLK